MAGQGSYDSSYNSLQFTLQRKFTSAGSLLVSYTNSKLISDTDTLTNWLEASNEITQDNNNNRGERSLSSQDVPRLVISYVADLPFGHGKNYLTDATGFLDKVLGGWSVNGITIFQKGFLLAFNNGIPNYTASFGGGSRPNVVAGCNKSSGVGGSGNWVNGLTPLVLQPLRISPMATNLVLIPRYALPA